MEKKLKKTLVKIFGGRDPCNPCGVDAYAVQSSSSLWVAPADHTTKRPRRSDRQVYSHLELTLTAAFILAWYVPSDRYNAT